MHLKVGLKIGLKIGCAWLLLGFVSTGVVGLVAQAQDFCDEVQAQAQDFCDEVLAAREREYSLRQKGYDYSHLPTTPSLHLVALETDIPGLQSLLKQTGADTIDIHKPDAQGHTAWDLAVLTYLRSLNSDRFNADFSIKAMQFAHTLLQAGANPRRPNANKDNILHTMLDFLQEAGGRARSARPDRLHNIMLEVLRPFDPEHVYLEPLYPEHHQFWHDVFNQLGPEEWNAVNRDGHTPLVTLAMAWTSAVHNGKTPTWASQWRPFFQLFLSYGASLTATDTYGRDVVNILLDAGAPLTESHSRRAGADNFNPIEFYKVPAQLMGRLKISSDPISLDAISRTQSVSNQKDLQKANFVHSHPVEAGWRTDFNYMQRKDQNFLRAVYLNDIQALQDKPRSYSDAAFAMALKVAAYYNYARLLDVVLRDEPKAPAMLAASEALHSAVYNSSLEAVRVLLRYGAPRDGRELEVAIEQGQIDVLKLLLRSIPGDKPDLLLRSYLLTAVKSKNIHMLRFVLEHSPSSLPVDLKQASDVVKMAVAVDKARADRAGELVLELLTAYKQRNVSVNEIMLYKGGHDQSGVRTAWDVWDVLAHSILKFPERMADQQHIIERIVLLIATEKQPPREGTLIDKQVLDASRVKSFLHRLEYTPRSALHDSLHYDAATLASSRIKYEHMLQSWMNFMAQYIQPECSDILKR